MESVQQTYAIGPTRKAHNDGEISRKPALFMQHTFQVDEHKAIIAYCSQTLGFLPYGCTFMSDNKGKSGNNTCKKGNYTSCLPGRFMLD